MPSQVNLKEQFPQTWPHYLLTFNVSPNVCVIVDFFTISYADLKPCDTYSMCKKQKLVILQSACL